MSGMSGPYLDYAESGNQFDDDTEQQLVGIGIRPEEAKRYVQGYQSVDADGRGESTASAKRLLSAFSK